jgi:SAM-dependent methyltransferase
MFVMSKNSAYRRSYGQFFTPDSVVACCYALLAGNLPTDPRVVDPACGDGAFLRYAAQHGLVSTERIAGCDVDAALVGALIAGGLCNIRCADGLDPASLDRAAFDLVIGNPPFGVDTPLGRDSPLASEVHFLQRSLELARPGGIVALVLPNGVLANERLRGLRADLLGRCAVLAVLALPRTAFRHAGTTAACSILLLRNAPAPPGHQVFFGLAGHLDDLPALVTAYHRSPWSVVSGQLQTPPDNGERTTDDGQVGQSPLPRGYPVVSGPLPVVSYNGQRATDNGQLEAYWLPQSAELARRLDAHFWRTDYRLLLERMAERHPLRRLGELIERRHGLIVGDHVRPSRGEVKGAGLPYEYYQTREFLPTGYNYAAIERCDERAYRRLRHTAVHQHDILVSCAGVGGAGQGRVCLITHLPGRSCTGDVFILRTSRPEPIFLFLFLASRGGRAQLLRLQNGVGTVNLSADELLQVEVPLLPAAAQAAVVARYAPIAAAHGRSMAALARGDTHEFQRARASGEMLLVELKSDMDEMLLAG